MANKYKMLDQYKIVLIHTRWQVVEGTSLTARSESTHPHDLMYENLDMST